MQTISTLSETELKQLLDAEVKGPKRAMFVIRLHQRYCMRRAAREREELLNECRTVHADRA